jgi:hypothetical protein
MGDPTPGEQLMATDQIQIPERTPDPLERFSSRLAAAQPSLTYDLAMRVLVELDPSNGVDRGKLKMIQKRMRSDHPLAKAIGGWLAKPAPDRPTKPIHQEPWKRAVPASTDRLSQPAGTTDRVLLPGESEPERSRPSGEHEPLTSADLMWLSRLPADPKEISDAETTHLAALAERVDHRKASPSDRMLVEQAFGPVKRYHERLVECSKLLAEVGIDAGSVLAGNRPARVPPAAVYEQRAADWAPLLHDLVEVPELTEVEKKNRVRDDLSARWLERDTQRAQARHQAFEALGAPEMQQAVVALSQQQSAA